MLTEKNAELKYDRALEEVWEWRRKAQKEYDALAHLSPEERCRIMNEHGAETMRQLGLNLRRHPGPVRKAD
jgi:hypothetical protein